MNNDVQNGPSTLPFRNLSRSRHISAPRRPALDRAAIVLPFAVPAETVETTDEFEIEVFASKESRYLDVRFLSPGQAKVAAPRSGEMMLVLPTGALLLMSLRRKSGARLASPFSL